MEEALRDGLAASRVSWLEHGYLEGDDTDAHIDTLARFAPGDAIVYQACDDATDPHHGELARMAQELAALRIAVQASHIACTPCPGRGRCSTRGGVLRRRTPTSSSSTARAGSAYDDVADVPPPRRGSSRDAYPGARSCRYPADR